MIDDTWIVDAKTPIGDLIDALDYRYAVEEMGSTTAYPNAIAAEREVKRREAERLELAKKVKRLEAKIKRLESR